MSRLKASSTPELQKRRGDYRKYRGGGKRFLFLSFSRRRRRRRRRRQREKGPPGDERKRVKGMREREKDARTAEVTGKEPPRECTVFIYDRRKIQASSFDHAGGRFPLIK